MSFLYILKSLVNSRYYVGSATSLKRRLEEHNLGKSKYTRLTRPFKLVFFAEYKTIKEAKFFEKKLKSFKSKKIIDKIVANKEIRLGS